MCSTARSLNFLYSVPPTFDQPLNEIFSKLDLSSWGWTPPHLSRWRAGDRAIRHVCRRLSLLLLACGRPAGFRLGLGSVGAPVSAIPPVLPLDCQESNRILPQPPLPLLPGLLLLSFGHACWTFCPGSLESWYRGGRDRVSRTASGFQTVSTRFAPLICCPAITLAGLRRPEAAVSRPAPPLSHTMNGRSRTLVLGRDQAKVHLFNSMKQD